MQERETSQWEHEANNLGPSAGKQLRRDQFRISSD